MDTVEGAAIFGGTDSRGTAGCINARFEKSRVALRAVSLVEGCATLRPRVDSRNAG